MKIMRHEDFWAGIMFIAFGVLAIVVSRNYSMGTAQRMGPGYFPTIIGWSLVFLGTIVSALALRTPSLGIGTWPWRAIVMMASAFALFAWGIETIGFVPALAGLIGIGALATPHYRWKEVAIELVVLLVGAWAVFIYGLGLPYRLWWGA